MKNLFSLSAAIAAVLSLTACGHNAVQYSDGVGVEIGFIPEQYQVALNFRYGKIFSAVVKEKAEVMLETDASNSGSAGSGDSVSGSTATGVKTTLRLKTADQITGYAVDLEKARSGK